MASRVCLVHYHEIGLKGRNRSSFENQLVTNIRRLLDAYPIASVGRVSGFVQVSLTDESRLDEVAHALTRIPGVALVSRAWQCEREQDAYCAAAVEALREAGDFRSFKVHARKSNTDYPLHTLDINRIVGSALCDEFPEKKVQMHGPDVTLTVLVCQGLVYVYAVSERGVGGLPVGTAGKVVSLISSGFDSPVATWMLGKRGATCVPVHFSGRPMTADTSEYLVQDLCRALAPSGVVGRLYVVPFGECQREISLAVPASLRIIMYRRLMFVVAERIARIEGAKALVTGESLGQVASQTLDNIAATNEAVSMPVLRPLIGTDKQEIIARSQELGCYDICCETAPDCCTLFMPRRPETHARPEQVHEAWELFDHEAMADLLVEASEYVDFESCPSYRPPRSRRPYHHRLGPASVAGKVG
ncbi:MAG: tRNA uracil 4-sulfurtransferase ThiI [Atopobiaceae bacterium]|jgi:thiamine biosynthesis protein ThiI|nr:tRNA 4-thiouridine(8) synthase ThiI [Atopobiaceae bacterium]